MTTVGVMPARRVRSSPFIILLILSAVMTPVTACDAPPAERFSVLVFSRTTGFRHESIPAGLDALRGLAARHDFALLETEDPSIFTDEKLATFAAIVFLSTTGDILDEGQQTAFQRYIRKGGGFVGIHAASDTEHEWPWYGTLVGAYFASHPQRIQEATVLVTDRLHPSTRHLPRRWRRLDEWYNFKDNPRGRVRVLAWLDERTYDGGTMGSEHPIAWCHELAGGRAWYTGGGHTNESFSEGLFLEHLLGGIVWAAGRAPGDSSATATRRENRKRP